MERVVCQEHLRVVSHAVQNVALRMHSVPFPSTRVREKTRRWQIPRLSRYFLLSHRKQVPCTPVAHSHVAKFDAHPARGGYITLR